MVYKVKTPKDYFDNFKSQLYLLKDFYFEYTSYNTEGDEVIWSDKTQQIDTSFDTSNNISDITQDYVTKTTTGNLSATTEILTTKPIKVDFSNTKDYNFKLYDADYYIHEHYKESKAVLNEAKVGDTPLYLSNYTPDEYLIPGKSIYEDITIKAPIKLTNVLLKTKKFKDCFKKEDIYFNSIDGFHFETLDGTRYTVDEFFDKFGDYMIVMGNEGEPWINNDGDGPGVTSYKPANNNTTIGPALPCDENWQLFDWDKEDVEKYEYDYLGQHLVYYIQKNALFDHDKPIYYVENNGNRYVYLNCNTPKIKLSTTEFDNLFSLSKETNLIVKPNLTKIPIPFDENIDSAYVDHVYHTMNENLNIVNSKPFYPVSNSYINTTLYYENIPFEKRHVKFVCMEANRMRFYGLTLYNKIELENYFHAFNIKYKYMYGYDNEIFPEDFVVRKVRRDALANKSLNLNVEKVRREALANNEKVLSVNKVRRK